MRQLTVKTLQAGALYFAIVFGVGVALGIVRVLGVVPRFGARTAELMEAPIMLLAIIFAARWVVRRLSLPARLSVRLGAGFIALGLLLGAEFFVITVVRHLSIRDYAASRDALAGFVYVAMLLFFAVMPSFVRSQ